MGIYTLRGGEFSDAALVRMAIESAIQVAYWTGEARAADPTSCPLLPRTAQEVVGMLTRKTLADLVEFGLSPDGWEREFMGGGA